jgi:2-keto-4-pentenoate hydratase/2-oxohepta-3-ene-1,7-dioic acid hydratase in catechol pathway
MTTLPVAGSSRGYELSPTKIVAVGLNYSEHVQESAAFGADLAVAPAEPVLFVKTPNTVAGHESAIVIPRIVAGYGFPEPRTDLEGELAVVIGSRVRNVGVDDALDAVLGYTCYNDVSQRNIQLGDVSGWFRGKSFDTFGPIGPMLVLAADMPDPQNLALTSRINGRTVQDGNTRDMIFGIPELIAFISRNLTLEAGDIIATGTPSGVSPISHGDIVEVEIEGIGLLRNTVVDESR